MTEKRQILFCILDWGLGHASRSIPIIKYLQKKGFSITVGTSYKLYHEFLKIELGHINFLELGNYNPKYSSSQTQIPTLISQLPRFFWVFISDHFKVSRFVRKHNPQLIFSDNRFSCWNKRVKSIYITHQLNILNPKSLVSWKFPTYIHRRIIKKYCLCLVPDFEDSLSGLLSEDLHLGIKKELIGVLSRFNAKPKSEKSGKFVLVLLSGPEPQRRIFEQRVIEQASKITDEIVLVRGTNDRLNQRIPSNVKVYHLVNSEILNRLIDDCSYVVSRSGYSSVMDMVMKGIPALLIPTPGQPEQEYLAAYLSDKKWFEIQDQQGFRFLSKEELLCLKRPPLFKNVGFEKIIDEML